MDLERPLFAGDSWTAVPEILRTSFCGRFAGRALEPDTDPGAVWGVIAAKLRELSHRVE